MWTVQEGCAPAPAGGAAMLLFSKKGRLKTGLQRVRLWPGRAADVACPSATPGKLPVAERGELGCAGCTTLLQHAGHAYRDEVLCRCNGTHSVSR